MKIIQAMKEVKRLKLKVDDLRLKITNHSADMDYKKEVYANQAEVVAGWIQSALDSVKEMARLRVAIQRTNLATDVTIELGGKQVIKTIAEWIHRRKDLAALDQVIWSSLTDRSLKDGFLNSSTGTQTKVTLRRYYQPEVRDGNVARYREEPSIIDGQLEVVNAVTDLIEA